MSYFINIVFWGFLLSSPTFAAVLTCEVKESDSVVVSAQVNTELGSKVKIGETASIVAFVSEKPNSTFVVEAYLRNYDARIYGQGILRNSADQVLARLWGRYALIDIQCFR